MGWSKPNVDIAKSRCNKSSCQCIDLTLEIHKELKIERWMLRRAVHDKAYKWGICQTNLHPLCLLKHIDYQRELILQHIRYWPPGYSKRWSTWLWKKGVQKCEELSREKSWNSGDQVKTRSFCSNIILHSAHIPDAFTNDIWVQHCKRQKFALTWWNFAKEYSPHVPIIISTYLDHLQYEKHNLQPYGNLPKSKQTENRCCIIWVAWNSFQSTNLTKELHNKLKVVHWTLRMLWEEGLCHHFKTAILPGSVFWSRV